MATKKDTTITFDEVWAEQRTVDEKLDFLAAALRATNPDAAELKRWYDNQKRVEEPEGNPADRDAKVS